MPALLPSLNTRAVLLRMQQHAVLLWIMQSLLLDTMARTTLPILLYATLGVHRGVIKVMRFWRYRTEMECAESTCSQLTQICYLSTIRQRPYGLT